MKARVNRRCPNHEVHAMKDYLILNVIAAAAIVATLSLPAATAQTQTVASTDDATTTPRTADGVPDLNGSWENGAGIPWLRPQQLGASICLVGCEELPQPPPLAGAGDEHPPSDRPRYKPEYMAKVSDLNARQVEADPVLRCENPGLPRIGPPDKIVQIPGQVVFLYDDVNGNFFRVIPTDGRGHRTDVEATYLGDATGYWEGNTLVVETVNFNDEAWLTDDGSFHTTDLRVVERLIRTDDTLQWQATAYDPAILAEPWEIRPRTTMLTDVEIFEAPRCIDRDLPLMQDGTSHDNPR